MRRKVYVPIGAPGAASQVMLRNASPDGRSLARIHAIAVHRSEIIQARRDNKGKSPRTRGQDWRKTGERSHVAPGLSGLRLVATLPPKHFFGGNNLRRAREQIAALRNLGAVVYEFDTAAVYYNDWPKIDQQQREIIEFRPDAAISTPHAGFVIQGCALPDPADLPTRRARNLFIDELELPVVLFWDHALTQAAHYSLRPMPETPCDSQGGAREALRSLFAHPNTVHLFPDSGHAEELGKLGIGSFNEDAWYVQSVGRAFADSGVQADAGKSFDDEVAFFGNIYLAASSRIPYAGNAALARLRDQARTSCAADWRLSAYHAYLRAIAALEPDERAELRLVPGQSFYWRFLYDELSFFMNGMERLRVLQSCGRDVAYFGNFNDPDSNAMMSGKYRLRGALQYDGTLAQAFRRTQVTIDVVNAPFINGFSVKLVDCFAAGGFVLTNHKSDISRAFGPLADEICCDSADELAGKLEFFLGHERRRLEVSREIGAIVRREYSGEALFARTLPMALERLKDYLPRESGPASGKDESTVTLSDLPDHLPDRAAGRAPGASRRIEPRRIRVEASSFCQLRCPACPTTSGHIHPAIGSGFLKFEDFRELLESNSALRQVEISNYGEVFLNPQLLPILEYAHQKGVAISIGNGANLNHVKDEVLEGLVKYRVRVMTCSIDGATPETYRKYRVRGNFDQVIRNIETINFHKRRHQSALPRLEWQFVVFGHNEHEISIAREMAAKLGMEFRTKLTWDAKFSPIRDAEFVRVQTGRRSITREEYEQEYGEKFASEICHQLWDDPQINWDGKVIGCCRNFWGDFGGNAFADGLMDSINNEKMIYAREMLSGRMPPRDDIPCSTCEIYIARRSRSNFIDRD
jgi:MoaA/NifB/PqqE/SkfB family radical SAM enzyme